MSKPREIVLFYFGRRFTKHVVSFFADLRIVDIGLKPSFLLDYGCIDSEKVISTINALFHKGYLVNKLQVLQVDSFEIFIFNRSVLLRHLEDMHLRPYLFIDVSATTKTPVELSESSTKDLVDTTLSCLTVIESSSNDLIQVMPSQLVNRSTLFGILLGYPVIYWYETSRQCNGKSEQTDTCLTMLPLIVHKVTVRFLGTSQPSPPNLLDIVTDKKHIAYSFSYPVDCHGVEPNVLLWKTRLDYLAESLKSISLHHEECTVAMDTVVL